MARVSSSTDAAIAVGVAVAGGDMDGAIAKKAAIAIHIFGYPNDALRNGGINWNAAAAFGKLCPGEVAGCRLEVD